MPEDLTAHYRRLFLEHGDTAEAAQYADRASQERRFEFLARVGDLEGSRVLDFGCGTGHLATFLADRGVNVRYTGVDLVQEMLEAGRKKHPLHRFVRSKEIEGERFDYAFVSGVFNNRRPDPRRFYRGIVHRLFAVCDRGLAFNMMSSYVDYYDPELFYEDPERVFRFIKKDVSPFVVIRNDYEVKPDVVPFEFTVYVYRRAVS